MLAIAPKGVDETVDFFKWHVLLFALTCASGRVGCPSYFKIGAEFPYKYFFLF